MTDNQGLKIVTLHTNKIACTCDGHTIFFSFASPGSVFLQAMMAFCKTHQILKRIHPRRPRINNAMSKAPPTIMSV